jgi:hypothetical protein
MKIKILIICLLLPISILAQFSTMFNDTLRPFGDGGYKFDCVCQDDSFYYGLGGVNNFQSNWQLMLLKMDKNGAITDRKKYDDSNTYYAAYPYNSMLLDGNKLLFTSTVRNTNSKDLSVIYAVNKYSLDTYK